MENLKIFIKNENPISLNFNQSIDILEIADFFIVDEKHEQIFDDFIFLRSKFMLPSINTFQLEYGENMNLGSVFGIYEENLAKDEEKCYFLSKEISIHSNKFEIELVDKNGNLINLKEKNWKYFFIINFKK